MSATAFGKFVDALLAASAALINEDGEGASREDCNDAEELTRFGTTIAAKGPVFSDHEYERMESVMKVVARLAKERRR